jgi:uncharacterized 2Fe-2S/4Fe-4S cluster protein (DUF4445 family)
VDCGSGILDSVAQMLQTGVIDFRGVLRQGHPAVRRTDGRLEFILAPAEASGHGRDVLVNRKDVNEIQLAKGAIRTGINILLQEVGLSDQELAIDDFIVAGAFGTYINIESAVQIGMFPRIPLERYRQVGNAAGAGARQMLVSGARASLPARLCPRSVMWSCPPTLILCGSSLTLYFPVYLEKE